MKQCFSYFKFPNSFCKQPQVLIYGVNSVLKMLIDTRYFLVRLFTQKVT